MVPLGLRHICFSANSFTRASSGVMVAHCRTGCACLALVHVCVPGRAARVRSGTRGAAPAAGGRATHLDADAIFLAPTVQNF